MKNLQIQLANLCNIKDIRHFTDYWLAGRGKKDNAPGVVNDYFITTSQHKRYITKYQTYIIILDHQIIAWAVIQTDGSLIHFLIAGTHRNQGIGSTFLNALAPRRIHSKSDQSSGNPASFYVKMGYLKTQTLPSKPRLNIDRIKPNRKDNIDIFQKIL